MKTIVCYGDSNTWGFMPKREEPASISGNRFPWGVRWTSVLQEKLGADYHVVEEGVNGRTTVFEAPFEMARNGLAHIDACLLAAFPVDLVIVMLGTNDIKPYYGQPTHGIGLGMQRLIAQIQNSGCGLHDDAPEILVVSPIRLNKEYTLGWLGEEFGEEALQKDADLPRQMKAAAESMHVHFLNASAEVEADAADGIHMNERGHARMAELIYEAVRKILA